MLLLPLTLTALAAAPALTSVAEASQLTETGRYDEVLTWCAAFPKRYPGKVRCEQFGTTPLGRPMVALVASADGVLTPDATVKKARPVLFLQGGIHAGEIDGKDAGFLLLRDALDGKLGDALGKVTLVFVPVLNVDGHERFGPNHRPNQRGPKAMGWRVTSQNLNLNRDYMKADAPETQAVLRLMHRFDPIVLADLHVTDGAKFQHDVSVTFEPYQTGPEALRALARTLKVELFVDLEAKGHLPVNFYPAFVKDDEPLSGFAYGWPPPRFSHAYWAARNRFGMLVETHSWKDYATRVRATYDTCAALLRLTAQFGPSWRAAALAADAADARRAGQKVTLLYAPTAKTRRLDFQGYEFTTEDSGVSGQSWVRYDETKPQVWSVPYQDELSPSLDVSVPGAGYLVPPPHAGWVAERLRVHGVSFTTLKAARIGVAAQQCRVTPDFRPGPYEGRLTLRASGVWQTVGVDVPAGTLFVPVAQPRLSLVLFLFEPSSPESFLSWGFFNAHLEQKEYLEDYLTEAYARELLEDAGVRREFEALLADAGFAKSPEARLRFFSERHPSFDAAYQRYPVLRVDAFEP